ncbi:DNA mismatch repair protein MLH1 [Cyberlindnera fabianii]|uniref:DNA mismatch repair protein MLH1 n=1 Tax=Cyberlindnera fabianii TaxID=36022 RepID=A0A1V2L2K8_CYBFA|nr:DNA mismatch repair protein MLH1 [Cyberlindnera fabianii]
MLLSVVVRMVNRIAAGEIIVAPANALKELLENSFDAGASRVEVVVKDGGLKLLQITDDGHGIHKDDLPLLCQRFATSKIEKYEDLESIDTYGFRGEALASISHVSRLSVVTRTADSDCAWRATYSDGELKEVKPTAGNRGTQIIVEDLFYNVPSRLRAVKGGSDELSKIVDVAGRYAIHSNVGIGVKKFGESHFALSTRPGLSVKERIRAVYGNSIAGELIPIDIDGIEDYGVVKSAGQITNPNYNNKKAIAPVFFINNRLVSNDVLRRALNSTISHFIPKGHRSFIYLSLLIKPQNLDVNVHPTKREVRFLHEDEIVEKICIRVTEELSKIDSSRSFPTQTLLPHNIRKRKVNEEEEEESKAPLAPSLQKKRLDYKLVRTDASQSRITSFIKAVESSQYTETPTEAPTRIFDSQLSDAEDDKSEATTVTNTTVIPSQAQTQAQAQHQHNYTKIDKPQVEVNLQSILNLREEVQLSSNRQLTEMFANLTYIGIVDSDRRLCAFQYNVKLMLVDYGSLLTEFFYQVALQEFSNFGIVRLETPVSLKHLLSHIYESEVETTLNVEDILDMIVDMREMLDEYFSIGIDVSNPDDPQLTTLPLMLKGYIPSLSKLPMFVYRMGAKVDWNDEEQCLDGILRQIAMLYTPEYISEGTPEMDEMQKQVLAQQRYDLNLTMENIIMPSVKRRFLAPHKLKKDVIEIANLPGLYRVFERC